MSRAKHDSRYFFLTRSGTAGMRNNLSPHGKIQKCDKILKYEQLAKLEIIFLLPSPALEILEIGHSQHTPNRPRIDIANDVNNEGEFAF